MDLQSRRQYLMGLREKYLRASRKEKTAILDEYIKNTGHNRKYVISILNLNDIWNPVNHRLKTRKRKYGADVDCQLINLWTIFDFPCGQRLKPCIETELDRLRQFGEINVSNELAEQLIKISSSTIDRRLSPHKKLLNKKRFSTTKPGSLLKAKIPVRLTDWNTNEIGFLEVDLVAHGGSSAYGGYIHTVSMTEIATGWWEGEAIIRKGQKAVFEAIKLIRQRTPFNWLGVDSDNGSEFINHIIWGYCRQTKIHFTRSRPNKKNDNAYVEQKNWTHVRKLLGYFRYDTQKELHIINDLYRNELRLYKNFFQPVMKLRKKVRIGAKIIRKYELPKTPFKRLIESNQINAETKINLTNTYSSLNPAALKRAIDHKISYLYKVYQAKHKNLNTKIYLNKEVSSVRF